MKEFIDCDEDKALFAYIENIIAGNKAITQTPEGSIIFTGSKLKISNPFLAIETFEIRYNEKKIDCAYKYEDYIKDKDIQATVKGLGMNPVCSAEKPAKLIISEAKSAAIQNILDNHLFPILRLLLFEQPCLNMAHQPPRMTFHKHVYVSHRKGYQRSLYTYAIIF